MIVRAFIPAYTCAGVVAVLIAGCSTLFTGQHAPGVLSVGSTTLAERWTRDGARYLVWPADDAAPVSGDLWVVLHDDAAVPEQLPLRDLCRAAGERGASLLLPQGSVPSSSSFGWQPARDSRAAMAAINDLRAARAINNAQTGLIGMGAGCAVAWRLIADHPGVFWCAGMVFGELPGDEQLLRRLPARLAGLSLFCAVDDTEESTNLVSWLAAHHIDARIRSASAGMYSFTPELKQALCAFIDGERERTCPVALVAPPHGMRVPVGAPMRLEAAISPGAPAVTAVWFEACSDTRDYAFSRCASATTQPFAASWTPEREGRYRLRARTFFAAGGWRVSEEISALAGSAIMMPPAGAILSPPRWATLLERALTHVDAEVQDADGQVTNVVFSALEAGPLGVVTQAPWRIAWSPRQCGFVTLGGCMTDNTGLTNWFAPVPVAVLAAGQRRMGFTGMPTPIPGRIDAENYDFGGADIGAHDTDPVDRGAGGCYRGGEGVDIALPGDGMVYVTDTAPGEWLTYSISCDEPGWYEPTVVAATAFGGASVALSVDGTGVTNMVHLAQTGGWRSFRPAKAAPMRIGAGTHVLRVAFPDGGVNLDAIIFRRPAP